MPSRKHIINSKIYERSFILAIYTTKSNVMKDQVALAARFAIGTSEINKLLSIIVIL